MASDVFAKDQITDGQSVFSQKDQVGKNNNRKKKKPNLSQSAEVKNQIKKESRQKLARQKLAKEHSQSSKDRATTKTEQRALKKDRLQLGQVSQDSSSLAKNKTAKSGQPISNNQQKTSLVSQETKEYSLGQTSANQAEEIGVKDQELSTQNKEKKSAKEYLAQTTSDPIKEKGSLKNQALVAVRKLTTNKQKTSSLTTKSSNLKTFPVPVEGIISKQSNVDYLKTPASRVGTITQNLTDKNRFAFALLFALLWVIFASILAIPWTTSLAETISWPGAIFVILGIAILPGYLTAFLISSVFLDKPRQLINNGLDWPGVSILIAAYNEENHLAKTVYGVLESDYQGDIEIIIVDDGSTDKTLFIAQRLEQLAKEFRPGLTVRFYSVKHKGKSYALNFGLNQANNDLVISLDADTILTRQAIRRIVSRMEVDKSSAVAGAVFALNSTENLLTRVQQWDYQIGIASIKRSQALWKSTLVAQGAFSLYQKDLLVKAGGWPDMIGEDIVLTWKLLDRAEKISFEPTAVAFTTVPSSIGQFIRQRSRWARGMIEGLKSHGTDLAFSKKFASHGILINYTFPWIDFSYTFFFIPGLFLAFSGNFAIVGPITLLVLPLNFIVFALIAGLQRKVFREVGVRTRPNKLGLFFYLIFYQFILAPVSLFGYVQEVFSHKRKW